MWPAEARAKFRLVLHHVLGGIYRLPGLVALDRAREMVALCSPSWMVESLDCSTTWDGAWSLGARFQPIYSEDFVDHYARNVSMLMREIPVALAVQTFHRTCRERAGPVSRPCAGRRCEREPSCGG